MNLSSPSLGIEAFGFFGGRIAGPFQINNDFRPSKALEIYAAGICGLSSFAFIFMLQEYEASLNLQMN